jgi:hypothetical protein
MKISQELMKRSVFLVAFIFLQAIVVLAAPWHYGLLEDLQDSGDVEVVKNEGVQKMHFTLKHPKSLVSKGVAASLEQLGRPIEKTERGPTTIHRTGWEEKSASFKRPFRTRKRFLVVLRELDPVTTDITLSTEAELQENYGWSPALGINTRNDIREILTGVAVFCRFPNSPETRASILASYKDNGTRAGKNGYELPPAEVWVEDKDVKATKTCPYCAEEILAEAIKCKYCKEFLDKPSPEKTASTIGANSNQVLIGKVINNSGNPGEEIGADGWLDIFWSSSESFFTIEINDSKGTKAFELSPEELVQFASGYQKAGKVARTTPAAKLVTTWECTREDRSSIGTTATQVPNLHLQVAFVGIQGGDRSMAIFAVPTWWPSNAKLASHYGKLSTDFDSLLSIALKIAESHISEESGITGD